MLFPDFRENIGSVAPISEHFFWGFFFLPPKAERGFFHRFAVWAFSFFALLRRTFFGAFFSGVRPFSFKSDSDFRNPFSALELHSFGLRDGSGKVGFQLLDLGCFSVLSQLSVFGLLRVVCYSFSAFSGRFSAVRSFGCSRLGSSSFSGLFRFIFLALKLLQYPCGMGV